MRKHSYGQQLLLVGNVLHFFIYGMLLIEHWGSNNALLYGGLLLLVIPSIVFAQKLKQTANNSYATYFIFLGLFLTTTFVGLFYIIGAILIILFNNKAREERRKMRVNL